MGALKLRLLRLLPVKMWMKAAWERRARENPMYFIADFQKNWDNIDQFFDSGAHDVDKVMHLARWENTVSADLLEIGCGLGRMTRHFATRFRTVTAVDISSQMISRAKEINSVATNINFQTCSGVDLRQFPDESFDYVLSYIVFQHIPKASATYGYIEESLRVLRPGGKFVFQARTNPHPGIPTTYSGAPIEIDEVKRIVNRRGRQLVMVHGQGTPFCYFEIR